MAFKAAVHQMGEHEEGATNKYRVEGSAGKSSNLLDGSGIYVFLAKIEPLVQEQILSLLAKYTQGTVTP